MGKNSARILSASRSKPQRSLFSGRLYPLLAGHLVLAATLFAACEGTPLTPEQEYERDHKQLVDLENWRLCEQVYKDAGRATIHDDHTHDRRGKTRHWYVRADLRDNNCRLVLGGVWQRY